MPIFAIKDKPPIRFSGNLPLHAKSVRRPDTGKLVNRVNGSILVHQVEGPGFASIQVNPKHLACI